MYDQLYYVIRQGCEMKQYVRLPSIYSCHPHVPPLRSIRTANLGP